MGNGACDLHDEYEIKSNNGDYNNDEDFDTEEWFG